MSQLIFADKYIVQEEIARGGMGVIYKALDRTLNRVVAIKLVHAHLSSDPSFAERFLREARAMARLHHENIVTIFSVEQDRGTQLLVMEYFPGMNLRNLLRERTRLPPREAVTIALQLAHALAYAHSHGIIHRDIKPANILVGPQSKTKLTDFGIAAALDEISITSTGQVIGTPEYMSPEQARGLKLDGRSDLYSFGMVFYEMLTGHTPYRDIPQTSILGKLITGQQELRLEFPPDVPSYLQSLIRELTQRDPADRLQGAEALAAQLTELLYSLPATAPLPPPATESESTTILTTPQARGPEPMAPDRDRTLAQPPTGTAPQVLRLSVPDATVLNPVLAQRGRTEEPSHATEQVAPPRAQAPTAPSPPSPARPSPRLASPLVPHRLLIITVALLAIVIAAAVYYFAPAPDRTALSAKASAPLGRPEGQPSSQAVPSERVFPITTSGTDGGTPTAPAGPFVDQDKSQNQSTTKNTQAQLEAERRQLQQDQSRLEDKQRLAKIQREKEQAESDRLRQERTKQKKEKALLAQQALQAEQQRQAEAAAKLEQERRQLEAQQASMEAERKRLTEEQQRLAKEKDHAIQQATIEEQQRKAQEATRLEKAREEMEARQADLEVTRKKLEQEHARLDKEKELSLQKAREEEQRRLDDERAAQERATQERAEKEKTVQRAKEEADRKRMEQERLRDAEEAERQKAIQVAKASSQEQLRGLLDRFRSAYEQRDLADLQDMSRMSESRLRNIRLMFNNYATFKVSLKNLSETETGATAVLVLESAATPEGETVDLPPIAKNIKVTIPREGSGWGKIIW